MASHMSILVVMKSISRLTNTALAWGCMCALYFWRLEFIDLCLLHMWTRHFHLRALPLVSSHAVRGARAPQEISIAGTRSLSLLSEALADRKRISLSRSLSQGFRSDPI